MKQFHAELASNPGHYSFGYSVYGLLEAGDDYDELYAMGYLPFVGVEHSERMMYMARGSRVDVQMFRERTYHARIRRKFQSEGQNVLVSQSFLWHEYPRREYALALIHSYFRSRHGASAMPSRRLQKIMEFDSKIQLVEYSIQGKVVAYSIEMPLKRSVHQWHYAYAPDWEGRHLGVRLMLDVIARAKAAGLQYAYLGATYGSGMVYKTNFRPIEYWDGMTWVRDVDRLKRLLVSDSLRRVVATDVWRHGRGEFYPAPIGFHSAFDEMRFLYILLTETPRIALSVGFLCILILGAIVTTFFP